MSDSGSPRDDHRPTQQGFQVTGGSVQIGNQAVGPGARAVAGDVRFRNAPPPPAAEAVELLAIIERLLDEHRGALPDQDASRLELRRLRKELAEEKPQPGVVRRALERLTAFVRPVTPLVVAVGELTRAVRGALGV